MTAAHGPVWLGVDLGTSSVKVLALADDGTVVDRASANYPTQRDRPDRAEQRPEDYLDAVATAIGRCDVSGAEVVGVGLAGQTPSLVLVDESGTAVRPAVIWQDQRATGEAAELAAALGDPVPIVGTSLPWSAGGSAAILLWLARHEPEALSRTRWLLQPKDFVGMALTGHPSSDPWSSKGLGTVVDPGPCRPVLDLAGVDPALLPPLQPAWHRRGAVDEPAARRFGLPAGVPVSVGWSDALAAMLAIGAFAQPGPFALTGTSDIVGVTAAESVPADATPLYSVPLSCAPLGIVYGPTSTSGAAVVWVADLLGVSVSEALELAASVPADEDDLPVFVPYLDGERAPIWRSDIAAGLTGLRTRHRRAHVARAVLDGVVGSERHILDVAERQLSGPAPGPVRTGGVGCTHPAWLAARGAGLDRPLVTADEPALSAYGAAMLGAAAAAGGDLSGVLRLTAASSMHPAPDGQSSTADRAQARYQAASRFAQADV